MLNVVQVKVGDDVEIVGLMEKNKKTIVTGIKMFRKLLDQAQVGDNIETLLRGIDKNVVERGMILAKSGTITPHKKFKTNVYVLPKKEGERHTPFFIGYKPQFYFKTTDVTGSIKLADGIEMIMPDNNAMLKVELISPVTLEKEQKFAIREGDRTVEVITDIVK